MADREVILWTMEQTNLVLLFKLFTVLALALFVLVFWRPSKGGRPPRAMHPSPADDSVLLWKRRKKKYPGCSGAGEEPAQRPSWALINFPHLISVTFTLKRTDRLRIRDVSNVLAGKSDR